MYQSMLKFIRESADLTQKNVAGILGLDATTYGHYENEDDIIPLKHLNTLCNYFNISLDYAFGFTTTPNYTNISSNLDLNVIGTNIKLLRKELKLTQERLAKVLKTNQSVIANYEKARYLISTQYLYAICKKYHISADYLLGRVDRPKYLNKQ